jgi:hypothetical protein
MKDDVLRCATFIKDAAGTTGRIVETIDAGTHYTLVFEWVRPEGKDGWFASKTVSLPKSQFIQAQGLGTGFELLLQQPLDLTQIQFRDVDMSTSDIPDGELRHARPHDESGT